jgi:hypothetical protein
MSNSAGTALSLPQLHSKHNSARHWSTLFLMLLPESISVLAIFGNELCVPTLCVPTTRRLTRRRPHNMLQNAWERDLYAQPSEKK